MRHHPLRSVTAVVGSLMLTSASVWLHACNDTVTLNHSTKLAQIQFITPPGAQVYLNTATDIRVANKRSDLSIELRKGEIALEVQHDRTRTVTIVVPGLFTVVDVGTQFGVKRDGQCAFLAVTEGTAELIIQGTDYGTVYSGRRVRVCEHDGKIEVKDEPVALATLRRELSWENGVLWFQGEKLRDAVHEVNRYSLNPIIIEDPEIDSFPVAGQMSIRNIAEFSKILSVYDIVVSEYHTEGSSVITLRARRKQ